MDFYNIKIKNIEKITANSVKIEFNIPENIKNIFKFNPGQFIIIKIGKERREYSICESPDDGKISIAVKAIKNGYISKILVYKTKINDILKISKPMGNSFQIKELDNKNFLCFANGSGITPIISFIKYNIKYKNTIYLFYSNKFLNDVMFKKDLDTLTNYNNFKIFYIYTQEPINRSIFNTRLNEDNIKYIFYKLININIIDYILICSQKKMINTLINVLSKMNFNIKNLYYETFNKDNIPHQLILNEEKYKIIKVNINNIKKELIWDKNSNIIDFLREHKIDVPYSCMSGICQSCKCNITEGEVLSSINDNITNCYINKDTILPCICIPKSDIIEINF